LRPQYGIYNKPAEGRKKDFHFYRDRLAHIYKYRQALKRLIYTTNPIESYHRMIRKVTKPKGLSIQKRQS
jgi:hypothetical protein